MAQGLDDDLFDEDPDESDQDHDECDEVAETVPCPFCQKPVYEHADVCKHCGNYIAADNAPRRVPVLIWVGVILAALCVLTWVLL